MNYNLILSANHFNQESMRKFGTTIFDYLYYGTANHDWLDELFCAECHSAWACHVGFKCSNPKFNTLPFEFYKHPLYTAWDTDTSVSFRNNFMTLLDKEHIKRGYNGEIILAIPY